MHYIKAFGFDPELANTAQIPNAILLVLYGGIVMFLLEYRKVLFFSIVTILLAVCISGGVIIKKYNYGKSQQTFRKKVDFITLTYIKGSSKKEIKITSKEEIKHLWDLLNYRLFLDISKESQLDKTGKMLVGYPTGQYPDGRYTFSFFDVRNDGTVGQLVNLKSYVEYYMPQYAKLVFELYRKYAITPFGSASLQ